MAPEITPTLPTIPTSIEDFKEADEKHQTEAGVKVEAVYGTDDGLDEVDEIIKDEEEFTDAEYKKLVRKIDAYLLPLMWFCYGIQQSDKTGIGYQAIFGIETDLKMKGQQYAWLTTIFYITYMCCEFPSNILLQRFPLGRVLSIAILLWGIVVICMAAVTSYRQLLALRAIQGALECMISPGFMFLIGSWWQTHEHAGRALVFQAGNAGYGVIASLADYGIGLHAEKHPGGLAPWRGISLFLGAGTLVAAALCFAFIGTPQEVWWLNEREKRMAVARIIRNKSGTAETGRRIWKWYQVREALMDPPTYFVFFHLILVCIPNGGASAFGSIVNKSFGFTSLQTIIYGLPGSFLSLGYFVVVGWGTTKFKNSRTYWMMFSSLAGFVGLFVCGILPIETKYRWDKWGGYFLFTLFVAALFLSWSVIPSNTTGRTKKSVVSSVVFVGYCLGNIIGSQIFTANQAPRYIPALVACSCCLLADVFLVFCWRMWYVWQNKKKDKAALESGLSAEEQTKLGKELGGLDKTDWENPHFRYTL